MENRPTELERAFALARSGEYDGVSAIRAQLKLEGYAAGQLQGMSLMRQLRALCIASRKPDEA
ncbi:MAG: hypothetical protein JWM33_462 [Caulobacteraceae bacterium]|nr:hypothetical protein [Caulobacteraceae bacterium]